MKIHDPLYGTFDLESVLAELIHTKPMQRLKHIHQGGASYLVNPKWNVTRFPHSVGVMLLIKKLGGPIEEQIAGLLHDVSHTAFSHVADFVFENEEQDFHEQIFEKILMSSEIPAVLEKHGFQLEDILPVEKWPLLEQPLPALCADRVDYTLRDLSAYGMIPLEEASKFADELRVFEGQICVSSIEAAEWFTKAYYKEVIDFFLHPLNVYGYAVLTDILKTGLEKNVIVQDDFLLQDDVVWEKILHSEEAEMKRKANLLHEGIQVIEDEQDYTIHQKKKLRMINPDVLVNDAKLQKATELSEKVAALNEAALKKSLKGTFVKVLK
jgi:HD superfamily phosphohydrolase